MMTETIFPGSFRFRRSINRMNSEHSKKILTSFADRTDEIAAQGRCRLESREFKAPDKAILYPGCGPGEASDENSMAIAMIYSAGSASESAQISIHWTVIDRNAQDALPLIEDAIGRKRDGEKDNLPTASISPTVLTNLLAALTAAYEQAARKD